MSANADLFAVRDAAFESAGTIRFANKFARFGVVSNLIVDFGTRQATGFSSRSDGDRLYSRYRHHCLRQKSIKLQIPGRVRAEARHDSAHRDLEDAAECVAFLS